MSVCSVSLCLFVFLVASVSLPPSLHFPPPRPRRLTSPLLPPSPTPHVISEKPNTPVSEAGFCKRRSSFGKFVRTSLIVVTVAVLPVVVCWQDCSSCLLRKCCVCLLFISLFGCLFSWWLLLASACLHFPPAQPRRLTSPLLPPSPTPHVISEKPNTPVSEAGFYNRRSSFGNFVRNVSACCCLLARLLFLFVEEVLCVSVLYLFVCLFVCLFVFLVASVTLPPPFTSLQHNLADPPSSQHSPHHTSSLRNQTLPFRKPSFATEQLRFAILAEKSCCCCLSVDPFVFFFFWWLLLASPLPSLPSTTTSQIDISPPPTIPHTTRHL